MAINDNKQDKIQQLMHNKYKNNTEEISHLGKIKTTYNPDTMTHSFCRKVGFKLSSYRSSGTMRTSHFTPDSTNLRLLLWSSRYRN